MLLSHRFQAVRTPSPAPRPALLYLPVPPVSPDLEPSCFRSDHFLSLVFSRIEWRAGKHREALPTPLAFPPCGSFLLWLHMLFLSLFDPLSGEFPVFAILSYSSSWSDVRPSTIHIPVPLCGNPPDPAHRPPAYYSHTTGKNRLLFPQMPPPADTAPPHRSRNRFSCFLPLLMERTSCLPR